MSSQRFNECLEKLGSKERILFGSSYADGFLMLARAITEFTLGMEQRIEQRVRASLTDKGK